jgi:hypothetical protein
MKIALSLVSASTTTSKQAHSVGSTIYEGFKLVLEGLYDCSDMFLPLKAAAGGLLKFINVVEVCILVYNNRLMGYSLLVSGGSDRAGE